MVYQAWKLVLGTKGNRARANRRGTIKRGGRSMMASGCKRLLTQSFDRLLRYTFLSSRLRFQVFQGLWVEFEGENRWCARCSAAIQPFFSITVSCRSAAAGDTRVVARHIMSQSSFDSARLGKTCRQVEICQGLLFFLSDSNLCCFDPTLVLASTAPIFHNRQAQYDLQHCPCPYFNFPCFRSATGNL